MFYNVVVVTIIVGCHEYIRSFKTGNILGKMLRFCVYDSKPTK